MLGFALLASCFGKIRANFVDGLPEKSGEGMGQSYFFDQILGKHILMYSPASLIFQPGSLGKFIFGPDFGKNKFHCTRLEANFVCGYLENGLS